MQRTEDGRYFVIKGRRWRAADPELPKSLHEALLSELGCARNAVKSAETDQQREKARGRVQLAKEGLGERGTPWWELGTAERHARAEARLALLRQDWAEGAAGSVREDD